MEKLKIIKLQEGIFKHIVSTDNCHDDDQVFYLTNYTKISIDNSTITITSTDYPRNFSFPNILIYSSPIATPVQATTMDDFVIELTNIGYPLSSYISVSSVGSNPQTVNSATTTTKGILKLSEDLGGNADAPKVVGIQGIPVSNTTPSFGDLLLFNGTSYVPTALANLISLASDEFIATASQTVFSLAHKPIGNVSIYINGVRISKQAVLIGNTNNQVVYVPSGNGNYQLEAGDLVIFDYKY